MFVLTHTKKDGTPVDDRSKQIMVMKYLNIIYLYFNHSYILNFLYKYNIFVFCNIMINLSSYHHNLKGCLLLLLLLLLLLHHL